MLRNAKSSKLFLRRLYRLLSVGFFIYAAGCVGCSLFQRKLIYFPPHYSPDQVNEAARAAGLERWTNASGQFIGMRRLSPRQPADGRILIVYGNGSWTVGCAHYADDIQDRAALDVYILEYPGYGDRAGSPSEKTILQAADEALQLLGTNNPVYLVGESLGSGVAAYLAGTHPDQVAGIVLLSPFNRLASVAQYHWPLFPVNLILVDKYPSEDYLRNYHGPVGIVVDGRDKVVPERFGLQLYEGCAAPKRLWRFPNGHHISIMEPAAKFWGDVFDFWHLNTATGPG